MTHSHGIFDPTKRKTTGDAPSADMIKISYNLVKVQRIIDGTEPGKYDKAKDVEALLTEALERVPAAIATILEENPDRCSQPFAAGKDPLVMALIHARNWGQNSGARRWDWAAEQFISAKAMLAHWEFIKITRLYGYRDPTDAEYKEYGFGGGC